MASEDSAAPVVVDDCRGVLLVYSDGAVVRRDGPGFATPVRDDGTVEWKDAEFDAPRGLGLRLYRPRQRNQLLPVFFYYHGGGFCISHPSWVLYHHFYARMACALPAVVVTAELPLAPEHRMPAQLDTGVDVLRRLRSIAMSDEGSLDDPAAELLREAADISRVFLVGDSSGGNLVHLVAARVGEDSG